MDLIEKINELINEITVEKLSSISGENKIKVEESIKACITTILYSLLNKNSEDLNSIINVSKHALEIPFNGQNYSVILKTIFGDSLESILQNISENTNTKLETVHLVSNSAIVCIMTAISGLVPRLEVFFVKNLLTESKEQINTYLPSYIDTKELVQNVTYKQVLSNLTVADIE